MKNPSRREADMLPTITSGASLADQMSARHLDQAREVIDPTGLPRQTVRWTEPPREPNPADAESEWKAIKAEAAEQARREEAARPRAFVKWIPLDAANAEEGDR